MMYTDDAGFNMSVTDAEEVLYSVPKAIEEDVMPCDIMQHYLLATNPSDIRSPESFVLCENASRRSTTVIDPVEMSSCKGLSAATHRVLVFDGGASVETRRPPMHMYYLCAECCRMFDKWLMDQMMIGEDPGRQKFYTPARLGGAEAAWYESGLEAYAHDHFLIVPWRTHTHWRVVHIDTQVDEQHPLLPVEHHITWAMDTVAEIRQGEDVGMTYDTVMTDRLTVREDDDVDPLELADALSVLATRFDESPARVFELNKDEGDDSGYGILNLFDEINQEAVVHHRYRLTGNRIRRVPIDVAVSVPVPIREILNPIVG